MNTSNLRQIIEEVITQPSPILAAAYADRNIELLLDPTCGRTVHEMLADEKRSHGVTRRYRALSSINAYTSALVRKRLSEGISMNLAEELPTIEVITAVNAGELIDLDAEAYEFRPGSFDKWSALLSPQLETRSSAEPTSEESLDDDLAVSRLITSLDTRLFSSSYKLSQAAANSADIVSECRGIIEDCEKLLTKARPRYYRIDRPSLQSKIADATRYMAQAYDAQGDIRSARPLFLAASQRYKDLGKSNDANRCLADIAWMHFIHEGDLDSAVQGINAILATVPENSIDHAGFLFDLAKINSAAGDDYEAEQIAKRVERELGAVPTGAEYADSLAESLMAVFSGQPDPTKGYIDTNRVRSLYHGLYFLLEKISRNKGDITNARKYHELLQDMDGTVNEGSKSNLEFSDRLSSKLGSLMEQMEKGSKGE